jgi:1-acyl-sn-glycerol-3-phosphate acyltransferase
VVPPRLLRRILIGPLVLVLALAGAVACLALVLVAAMLTGLLPGPRRLLRLATFALVYLLVEAGAIMACLGMWLAGGFGWRLRSAGFQEAHYALARWFLGSLVRTAKRMLRFRVAVDGPSAREVATGRAGRRQRLPARPEGARPLIVLARHAGAGDSFLVTHQLLSVYARRPRIVMKRLLQLDPVLDVLGNRLPNAFIAPRPGADVEITARIGELAAGMEPAGALLIFPEGGNFSERRRASAIRRLRELALHRQADQARGMRHVAPPRPGGVATAVEAAPEADVVFVAHTGLEHLSSPQAIWRQVPFGDAIRARWWLVPAADIPREREEQTAWLYEWWTRLDGWIAAHRPAAEVGAAARAAP